MEDSNVDESSARNEDMRVLIVGGGIAGLTLAALLRQRGIEPTTVEKVDEYGEAGYLLTLWPMGNRILHGLGLYESFEARSVPVRNYSIHNRSGSLLHKYHVGDWVKRYGDARTLRRSALLDVLRSYDSGTPVRMGTSVERVKQAGDAVQVSFTDGTSGEFDLVVGADGIDSRVRELVFGEVPYNDTGYGLWMWWCDPGVNHDEITEFWGAGTLFGIYPGQEVVGCAAAFPREEVSSTPERSNSNESFRELCRRRLRGFDDPLIDHALAGLDEAPSVDYTPVADVRTDRWQSGRVMLIGDAGAAFLPTAGVGASMAMESAAVLAEELSRVDTAGVPRALDLYVKRRRARVDAIQSESRRVAKLMRLDRKPFIIGRNALIRVLPVELMFRNVSSRLGEPI